MKNIFFAIFIMLAGCGAGPVYLTPQEVAANLPKVNQTLAGEVSEIDAAIRQVQSMVINLAQREVLTKPEFMQIRSHLLTAGYFNSRAWSLVLELNDKDAKTLNDLAESEMKRGIDLTVSFVDKKNSL
jgi:predicted small lipoprotein YifL